MLVFIVLSSPPSPPSHAHANDLQIPAETQDASMQEWEWETGQLKSKFFGSRTKTVGVAATRGGGSGGSSGGISCLAGTGSAVLTAGWDKTVRMWPRSSPAPQSQEAVAAAAAAAAASALRR